MSTVKRSEREYNLEGTTVALISRILLPLQVPGSKHQPERDRDQRNNFVSRGTPTLDGRTVGDSRGHLNIYRETRSNTVADEAHSG